VGLNREFERGTLETLVNCTSLSTESIFSSQRVKT
jgi:hypothetical protein